MLNLNLVFTHSDIYKTFQSAHFLSWLFYYQYNVLLKKLVTLENHPFSLSSPTLVIAWKKELLTKL